MTREEILAMQPGREMDAIVAELVIGIENHRAAYENDENGIWFGRVPDLRLYHVPSYSSSIAAAWEVVKLLSKDYGVSVYEDDGAPCECTLVRYPETIAVAEGTTAPEAICKAALIACMEMRDKE